MTNEELELFKQLSTVKGLDHIVTKVDEDVYYKTYRNKELTIDAWVQSDNDEVLSIYCYKEEGEDLCQADDRIDFMREMIADSEITKILE